VEARHEESRSASFRSDQIAQGFPVAIRRLWYGIAAACGVPRGPASSDRRRGPRQLVTVTATAGIRGTGIYIESSLEQTYFCTCYGTVEIADRQRAEKRLVASGYHAPNIIPAQRTDGKMARPAEIVNHTDEELVMLEKLVGRVPPFVSKEAGDK
jgi:hypothetical protein